MLLSEGQPKAAVTLDRLTLCKPPLVQMVEHGEDTVGRRRHMVDTNIGTAEYHGMKMV